MRPAERSERISPYKLGMTMTVSAKGVGSVAIYLSADYPHSLQLTYSETDSVQ